MLSQAQNDLVTRTGPGTPGGRLLRSYWQPLVTSEEFPVGSAPLPVRIMSEDLVLFRDDQDRLGHAGRLFWCWRGAGRGPAPCRLADRIIPISLRFGNPGELA